MLQQRPPVLMSNDEVDLDLNQGGARSRTEVRRARTTPSQVERPSQAASTQAISAVARMDFRLPAFFLLALSSSSCGDTSTHGSAREAVDAATKHEEEPVEICNSCDSCSESFVITHRDHVGGDIKYTDPPPVGGNHNPCWTPWGVHETEVPDEKWVHNLEHGGVVYLYNCKDGCDAEVKQLEAIVKSQGNYAVLTPYSLLPKRFAIVAWEHRLVSDCLDLDAYKEFYKEHVGRGPEQERDNPPANCSL
jgi:hypothetical protein